MADELLDEGAAGGSVAVGSVRTVSIGRVFGRAFRAIARNPLVIVGVALIFALLPQLVTSWLSSLNQTEADDNASLALIVFTVASYLVSVVFSTLAQGALVRTTVAASEGRRAGFGESLGAALPVALPLIGLSIVVSVGIALGFVLLIVPGVILYVWWIVAAPVLVEERTGVFGAMGRSRELTKGARWTVFGLLLTAAIFYMIVAAIAGVLVLASGLSDFGSDAGETWPALIGATVFGTLTTALWSVIVSSLYVELREWKDGPAEGALTDIFA